MLTRIAIAASGLIDPERSWSSMTGDLHERAHGVESELGATLGDTHEGVLMKALGHERGLAVSILRGPPPVRKAKEE